MAGSLALKWKKQDEVVNGNTLVARSRVRVQSRLAVNPTKYTVHEVLPEDSVAQLGSRNARTGAARRTARQSVERDVGRFVYLRNLVACCPA